MSETQKLLAIPDEHYKTLVKKIKKHRTFTAENEKGVSYLFSERDGNIVASSSPEDIAFVVPQSYATKIKEEQAASVGVEPEVIDLVRESHIDFVKAVVRKEHPELSEEEITEKALFIKEVQASMKTLIEAGIEPRKAYELLGVGLKALDIEL